jgi:hypothetical protein
MSEEEEISVIIAGHFNHRFGNKAFHNCCHPEAKRKHDMLKLCRDQRKLLKKYHNTDETLFGSNHHNVISLLQSSSKRRSLLAQKGEACNKTNVMIIVFFNHESAVYPTKYNMTQSQKRKACQWQNHHDSAFSCSRKLLLKFLAKYCTPQV